LDSQIICQKINQSYTIELAKIKREFTTPTDTFFLSQFSILIGNQAGAKGKHSKIEMRTKSGTEGQHF